MAISSAMYNGVSGMNSFSTALEVTSDNVANAGTTGFKSNTARFGDMVSSYYNTQSKDTDRRGSGSMVMKIATDYAQGPMMNTSSWSDMAINGPGYFCLAKTIDANGNVDGKSFYSRDGSFYMDKDGYLVNSQGYHVLGSDNGRGVPIRIEMNPSDPVYANYYVDNTGQIWGYHVNPPDDTRLSVVHSEAVGTLAPVYDQDGVLDPFVPQEEVGLTFGTFSIDSQGRWTYDLDPDNAQVQGLGDGQTLTETITVVTDGGGTETIDITIVGPNDVTTAAWWDPQRIANPVQIVIFPNEGGLIRQGGNLFLPGPTSKDAVDVTLNPALRGDIAGFTLENSNVDLAREMVNMIIYQASYNANTKSITTSRDMLDTTINLIR